MSLTRHDHYPSRQTNHPTLRPRQDPVVYGHAQQGPLDVRALEHYATQGYLHLEHFFTPHDVQQFVQALTALQSQLQSDPALRAAPNVIIEPDSHALRSLFAVHKHSEIMRNLCQHPRLVAIAQQLLGSDVYIHQSRINYKGGFYGKEFYWHSDFETWHTEDGMPAMRAVSCSISLTDNTPHNGPLMIIPGSHRVFVGCVGLTPENHFEQSLRKQEVGVPDPQSLTDLVQKGGIVAPTGQAGAVTFFECNVMHGSNSNITPYPRSNVFVVYNSVDNALEQPFCGLAPRPDYIAHRDNLRV